MKEAIAGTYIYNIVFIFMAIVFAFAMGTVIYYKSIKVNKVILSSIEKYEGYNDLSRNDIENNLKSIGYGVVADGKCPKKEGIEAERPINMSAKYCVYLFNSDTTDHAGADGINVERNEWNYEDTYPDFYNTIEADRQCPPRSGFALAERSISPTYKYCMYFKINPVINNVANGGNKFYSYGVITYITFDFPFANIFIKIPIYTKSNRIFNFSA